MTEIASELPAANEESETETEEGHLEEEVDQSMHSGEGLGIVLDEIDIQRSVRVRRVEGERQRHLLFIESVSVSRTRA
jgi:hypothetical protein